MSVVSNQNLRLGERQSINIIQSRLQATRLAKSKQPLRHSGNITLSDVTVIVPTRNEAANIATFLASVPNEVHLVVVDSSEDDTAKIITEARPNRTRIIREALTIPEARQRGAELANTEWLLFTDADVVFGPEYFETLCALKRPTRFGGIVGTKATHDGFDAYHTFFRRGQKVLHLLGIPAASGSNMLVQRRVLFEVGGFDPALTVNEDTELFFRIVRANYDVRLVTSLVVQAFDHRRLETGTLRKVLHGAVRNSCLFLGIYEKRVRTSDWGYWQNTGRGKANGST